MRPRSLISPRSLLIAGQVASSDAGKGAFQDSSAAGLDDRALISGITRYCQTVDDADTLPHHLHVALRAMQGIERGPACLCIPLHTQIGSVSQAYRPLDRCTKGPPRLVDRLAVKRLVKHLRVSAEQKESPLQRLAILVGHGAVISESTDLLAEFR